MNSEEQLASIKSLLLRLRDHAERVNAVAWGNEDAIRYVTMPVFAEGGAGLMMVKVLGRSSKSRRRTTRTNGSISGWPN
jgi:hypothetical protein